MSPEGLARTTIAPPPDTPLSNDDEVTRWATFEREAIPHLDTVFRHAMWWAQNRATAEDLTQETYMQALKSFANYTAGTNCRAWLLKILYNLNQKRRNIAARIEMIDNFDDRLFDTFAHEESTPQNLTDECILQTLEILPLRFQEVIILSDVEEFSYKEIAALLNVPIGTVMSRLHRGRRLLRTALAVYAQTYGIRCADNTESRVRESSLRSVR